MTSPAPIPRTALLAAVYGAAVARLAAAEGAPTTFGVSAARRELASHPGARELTARSAPGLGTPGGGTHVAAGPRGDGGGRASRITFTVHPNAHDGARSHEVLRSADAAQRTAL